MDHHNVSLRFNILLVLLLLITLFSLRGLSGDISRVQARLPHDSSHELLNMTHRLQSLEALLVDMQTQSRWVAAVDVHPVPEESSPGSIALDVDWSFRELETDALVSLLYRQGANEDWTDVPAQPTGTGSYRARMTIQGAGEVQYRISAVSALERSSDIYNVPGHLYRAPDVQVISSAGHGMGISQGPSAFTFHLAPIQQARYPFHKIRSAHADLYVNGTIERSVVLKTWGDTYSAPPGDDISEHSPIHWESELYQEIKNGYGIDPQSSVWVMHLENVPTDLDPDPVATIRIVYEDLSVRTYLLHFEGSYLEPMDS